MLQHNQTVAAIHDLSGVGRCSLSVILPVLSVMGVQACPVPTAVLSTHTGGLGNFVFRDLTDYINEALRHYQELELSFDCVYSGFLGSEEQITHCAEFWKHIRKRLQLWTRLWETMASLIKPIPAKCAAGWGSWFAAPI